jgi:hypothetical protein
MFTVLKHQEHTAGHHQQQQQQQQELLSSAKQHRPQACIYPQLAAVAFHVIPAASGAAAADYSVALFTVN